MALDLIIRNARLASAGTDYPTVDIGVRDGIIAAVERGIGIFNTIFHQSAIYPATG